MTITPELIRPEGRTLDEKDGWCFEASRIVDVESGSVSLDQKIVHRSSEGIIWPHISLRKPFTKFLALVISCISFLRRIWPRQNREGDSFDTKTSRPSISERYASNNLTWIHL